jgi:bifunctional polynucleotide phosphatase/kinase
MSWETLDETLVRLVHKRSLVVQQEYPTKLAMFDLDGTLTKTRSGRVHPRDAGDWQWWSAEVIPKLQELVKKDYGLIIVTNQAGAENKARKEDILERIEAIFREIIDSCEPKHAEVYIALARDVYRKPNTSIFEKYIWPHFSSLEKKEKKIERIFYVGDAAGRPGDFADSDRKFAFNLHLFLKYKLEDQSPGVKFLTPEEYFSGDTVQSREWEGFNPYTYYQESKKREKVKTQELVQTIKHDHRSDFLILIMVGPPASGKSTLSRTIIKEFPDSVYINQDTCRTKAKCVSEFKKALENWGDDATPQNADRPKIIIIDNTNPGREIRLGYMKEARAREREQNIRITIKTVLMIESPELYEHLNVYRERIAFHRAEEGSSATEYKRVPEITYKTFYKNYEDPAEHEGADQIIRLQFVPDFRSKYEILMFLQRS